MTLSLSNIVVTPGLGQVFFLWRVTDSNGDRGPTYTRFDAVEVWRGFTSPLSAAVKVAEGDERHGYLVALDGRPAWYWFRVRDQGGNVSAFSSAHFVESQGEVENERESGGWKFPAQHIDPFSGAALFGFAFNWGQPDSVFGVNYEVIFHNTYAVIATPAPGSGGTPFPTNRDFATCVFQSVNGKLNPLILTMFPFTSLNGIVSTASLRSGFLAIGDVGS